MLPLVIKRHHLYLKTAGFDDPTRKKSIYDLIFTFTHIRYHTGTLFTTTYIETDKISKLIDIVEKVIHVEGPHDDIPCAHKDGNHFDESR